MDFIKRSEWFEIVKKHVQNVKETRWWKQGQIYVLTEETPTSKQKLFQSILRGWLRDFGFEFKIKIKDIHFDYPEELTEKNIWNFIKQLNKLFNFQPKILLTNRNIAGGSIYDLAGFKSGFAIIDTKISDEFFSRVAQHTLFHLFGLFFHCNDYLNVEDYEYNSECLMHGNFPSGIVCQKCSDYIKFFWQELKRTE